MNLNSIPYHIPAGIYRYRGLNLLCNEDKKDWHVFSVVEKLEPDMQDYNDGVQYVFAKGDGQKKYKMYFVYCDFEVTTDFLTNPVSPVTLNAGRGDFQTYCFNSGFLSVPSEGSYYTLGDSNGEGIGRILPVRMGPTFVKSYVDNRRSTLKVIEEESYLNKQLNELSTKFFGLDLCIFKEHIGNRYLVWHDEIFKSFHVRSHSKPNGILLDVVYRSNRYRAFRLRVTDMQQTNCPVVDYIWDIVQGARSIFIPLENIPSLCGFYFYSEDGMLLYYISNCYFVYAIAPRIGFCEKSLIIKTKNDDGNYIESEPINKYKFIDELIGCKCDDGSSYFSKNETYHKIKELEDKKEFLFFDGSKSDEKKSENKQKARNAVMEIINRAQKLCYICDPYFNSNDFDEYIARVESLDVKIRIINSKADVQRQDLGCLEERINLYNAHVAGSKQVECRVLRGNESRLHDRFIIVDELVWYMGSSFSEFGARACSLAKLSESASLCVKTYIEEWWNSVEVSMPIAEINRTENTN